MFTWSFLPFDNCRLFRQSGTGKSWKNATCTSLESYGNLLNLSKNMKYVTDSMAN